MSPIWTVDVANYKVGFILRWNKFNLIKIALKTIIIMKLGTEILQGIKPDHRIE